MKQVALEEVKVMQKATLLHGIQPFLRALLSKSSVLPILIPLWIVFSLLSPTFATQRNLQTLLAATAVVAVAAVGQTLVLIIAGIDISVASVAACSGIIAAAVMGNEGEWWVGLGVALGVGLFFGLFNGVSIAKLGLTPFVLTLGTHLVARGIAFTVSKGIAIPVPEVIRTFGKTNWFGIPAIAVIAILTMMVFGVLLTQTTWGRHLYLLGAHPNAARYVGIRRGLIVTSVYTISGVLSGLAGFLAMANLGAAIPGVGDKILLTIIGGVILGGTSMFGGIGSMQRTAMGVLLLATMTNGLNLLGFDFYDQLIAQGIVIIAGTALTARLGQEQATDS
jgi:ribose transport system permease protein